MYTSDELNILPSAFEKIFGAMENDIMQDIINRIAENDEITRTADWEMFRMRSLGAVNDDIQSRIKTTLNMSDNVLDNMFEKVIEEGYTRDEEMYKTTGKQFIPYEENKELQQLVQAVKNQTRGEFFNITGTMGFSVKKPSGNKEFQSIDNYFKDILDKVSMHVLNGTYDYNSMINKVVNEMTNSGVRTIDYESGYSSRVEVAARRAIITGTNQVTSKISEENMEKLDTEFVETSWHSTARPTHQIWQGRVFHWKKNLEKCDESSTIKEKDILIHKSIGAKAKNYDVLDVNTGEFFHFVGGTKIQDSEVFAGYKVKNSLRPEVAEGLTEEFGGKVERWQHAKGKAVIDRNGEAVKAEVHWFQEDSVGKVKFKVKEWLEDES